MFCLFATTFLSSYRAKFDMEYVDEALGNSLEVFHVSICLQIHEV